MRICGTFFRHRSIRLAAALACVVAGVGAAHAAPTLLKNVPAAVAYNLAPRVGSPDPATKLFLAVTLPMRNQAQLDALLKDIYNPKSPLYRHYLSVAEYTTRFGPSTADYEAATKFFTGKGLQVTSTSANRHLIDVAGSVTDVERVFHVKMGLYKHPTENRNFVSPDREPTLDLPVAIQAVIGLDDFALPSPRSFQAAVSSAHFGTGSAPNGNFLGSDIRRAYAGNSTLTGTGQSLGLMELEGYNVSDVQLYFSKFGPPLTAQVNGISTDGSPIPCTAPACRDDSEQALDIEYAIAMAPGLSQVQVYVAKHAISVINRMASDNSSKQLSTSWGWAENFAVDDPIFKEMAAQGQTFLTASGDFSSLQKSGPWPEEDANLTAVGGTDLTMLGAGSEWLKETGWASSAGGPSLDKTISIEDYQLPFINSVNAGSSRLRNVPDIAGDANSDNYICYNAKCNGGWGGTSFASPIWAGFIALANEEAASNNKPPVGFINPTLYALASGSSSQYSALFHDETKGKSGHFSAGPSFDLVTGLGSPHGQALIDALIAGVNK